MITIRAIVESDWSAIDNIQRAAYPADAQESLEAMRCHWRLSPATCFVAERDGRVEAYALSHPWVLRQAPPINVVYSSLPKNPDCLYLHDVAVFPRARGSGLATTLVRHILETAQRQTLSVCSLISVQGSREFWRKFGFREVTNLPEGFFDAAHTHYRDRSCVYMVRTGPIGYRPR